MARELALEDPDFESRAVSPLREMGAYEALWAEPGTTLKSLPVRFTRHPGSVPVEVRRRYAATVDAREANALGRVLSTCVPTKMILRSCDAGSSAAVPSTSRDVQSSGTTDVLRLWDDNGNGRITCREARRHGIAPAPRGHPAYPSMYDGDGEGVVCEQLRFPCPLRL